MGQEGTCGRSCRCAAVRGSCHRSHCPAPCTCDHMVHQQLSLPTEISITFAMHYKQVLWCPQRSQRQILPGVCSLLAPCTVLCRGDLHSVRSMPSQYEHCQTCPTTLNTSPMLRLCNTVALTKAGLMHAMKGSGLHPLNCCMGTLMGAMAG